MFTKFTEELYESYLKGEIYFSDLALRVEVSISKLRGYFKKNNLKYRQTVLKETTCHTFFDCIDNEIKAYLLGFLYADGSINKNKHIGISLSKADEEIIDLFQTHICPFNKKSYRKSYLHKNGYVTKEMVGITFKSEHMCRTLLNYGIKPNKTYLNLDNLNFIPEHLLVHFIRGYWDGDGTSCITKGKKKHKLKSGEIKLYDYTNYNWNIISNTNSHLIILQNFLLNYFNIKANVLKESRGHFLLEVNRKKDYFLLREKLYENANFFLKRKKEKYMAIPC